MILRRMLSRILIVLLQSLPLERLVDPFFRALNLRGKIYATFRKRLFEIRNYSGDLPSLEYQFKRSDIGIILQGPICHRQNFTYLTIVRYLHCFPSAQIVLATWESEKLEKFRKLSSDFPRLHILELEKPSFPGPFNINYQICSTKAGLSKVQELNLEYVIKSRTDQCLYDVFALDKLRNTLETYPSSLNESRIVFLSFNSFLFRLYGPSDMFQFGKTLQVAKYWDVSFDFREGLDDFLKPLSLRDYSREEICEVYVCANYLRSLGLKLDFSMSQNLAIFRDLFIVLDASEVDLLWNKYTYDENRWAIEEFPHKNQEWNFAIWVNLDSQMEFLSSYDHFLD
jgi:hypothetical protein